MAPGEGVLTLSIGGRGNQIRAQIEETTAELRAHPAGWKKCVRKADTSIAFEDLDELIR